MKVYYSIPEIRTPHYSGQSQRCPHTFRGSTVTWFSCWAVLLYNVIISDDQLDMHRPTSGLRFVISLSSDHWCDGSYNDLWTLGLSICINQCQRSKCAYLRWPQVFLITIPRSLPQRFQWIIIISLLCSLNYIILPAMQVCDYYYPLSLQASWLLTMESVCWSLTLQEDQWSLQDSLSL